MSASSGIPASAESGGAVKKDSHLNSASANPGPEPKPLGSLLSDSNAIAQIEEDVPMSFPQKLMEMLDDELTSDTIAWLPHGKGFIIYKKKKLAAEILPRYFKQSKFTSFTRKLNRWGFNRITRGHEMGAYYHSLFQRGETRLCLQMSCQSGTKSAQDKDQQQFVLGGDMTHQNQHLIRQQLQQLQLQQMHLQQLQMQQQQQLQAAEFFRQAVANGNGTKPSEAGTADAKMSETASSNPTDAAVSSEGAAKPNTAAPPTTAMPPLDFHNNMLLQSLQRTKDSAAFAAGMALPMPSTTTPPMMGLMPTPMLPTPADFAAQLQGMSGVPSMTAGAKTDGTAAAAQPAQGPASAVKTDDPATFTV